MCRLGSWYPFCTLIAYSSTSYAWELRGAMLLGRLTSDLLIVQSTEDAPAEGHDSSSLAAYLLASYRGARSALRGANGIRVLLSLLQSRSSMPVSHADKVRALATRSLLGLAHDPAIQHILAKLQVCLAHLSYIDSCISLLPLTVLVLAVEVGVLTC